METTLRGPSAIRVLAHLLLGATLLCALDSLALTPLEETRALEQAASRNPRQAIKEAGQWLQRAQAASDKPGQLRALRLLAMANDQVEDGPALAVAAERGAALARELDNKVALCEFMTAKAAVATHDGRHVEALRLYDRAVAFAEQNRLERDLGKILVGKARAYDGLERTSEALAHLHRAYAVFEAQHDPLLMSQALSEIANIYVSENASKEDLAKALEYHQRAVDLIDPKVNRFELGTHYHNLGVAYYRLKDVAKAKQLFEKTLAIAREVKDPVTIAYVSYRLGKIAREEKRPAEALAQFDKALPVFAETGNAAMQFNTHLERARTLSELGRRAESLDALAAAKGLAKQIGSPRRDAQLLESTAQIHARLGEFEKAYREMDALREAEQRVMSTANAKLAAELQARFDARQKEMDNALLRAQSEELEARRLALLLALILSLVVVGGLVAFLVRQARQNRRFASLAMRDDLTGLPNRRSILEFANLQFRGRRAGDKGFCVALIDIDHFKSINDEYGHSVGDAVLVAFAHACQHQLRSNDRIGRFGGEEFLLCLPASDTSQIPALFDRLRTAVRSIEVEGHPGDQRLSFSLGASVAAGDDDSLEKLIKRADDALYKAKHSGRDRYEIA